MQPVKTASIKNYLIKTKPNSRYSLKSKLMKKKKNINIDDTLRNSTLISFYFVKIKVLIIKIHNLTGHV